MPPRCQDTQCAVLLADFPGAGQAIKYQKSSNINQILMLNNNIFSAAVTRSSSRSAVVELITRLELFVTVAFVGDNLEEVVDFMDR